jgi:hypothetical protein
VNSSITYAEIATDTIPMGDLQAGTVFIAGGAVLPESLTLKSAPDTNGWQSLAFQRITASVKSQKCNSLQITRVESKSFLKVPYVTVTAHSRHLQEWPSFAGQ